MNNSPCGVFQVHVLTEHFEFCFKQDLMLILDLNLIKIEEKSIENLSTHTANHTTITVIITRTLSYLVMLFWLTLALRLLFSGRDSAGN
jgi:hypothetical protein